MLKSVQSLGFDGCLVVLCQAIGCLAVTPLGAFLFLVCLAIPHMWWVSVLMFQSPVLLCLALAWSNRDK